MNGEMFQLCSIVAAAKKALIEKQPINYELSNYERIIEFKLLPEKTESRVKVDSVDAWFEKCLARGLEDVKILAPISVDDRQLLGFINTTQSSIGCFYSDGKVIYAAPEWKINNDIKMWEITYVEHLWDNPPPYKPKFEDNTESFAAILSEIEEFAVTIGADNFARVFKEAKNCLYGNVVSGFESRIVLPEKNKRIFMAASHADVFGAMGSWNDSPPYDAEEKGLGQKYNDLSAELLRQIRLAILYSVNEWHG